MNSAASRRRAKGIAALGVAILLLVGAGTYVFGGPSTPSLALTPSQRPLIETASQAVAGEHAAVRETAATQALSAATPMGAGLDPATVGWIRGRVVDEYGNAIESARVLAAPTTLLFTDPRDGGVDVVAPELELWAKRPGFGEATTDATGAFEIDGLFAEDSYWLFAGAPGFGQIAFSSGVEPGTDGVSVRLQCVQVVLVRMVDPDGGPPRAWDASIDDRGYAEVVGGEVGLRSILPIAHMLAGLPTLAAGEELYVIACTSGKPAVLGARLTNAGYAPIEVELPFGSSPPAATIVQLERTATGFGTVVVQLPALPADTRYEGTLGVLFFTAQDRERLMWWFDWPAGNEVVLDGVPFGDYDVRFQPWSPASMGLKRVVPARIVVGDAAATLRLEAGGNNGMLELFPSAAFPFEGDLDVHISVSYGHYGHLEQGEVLDPWVRIRGRALLPWVPAASYRVHAVWPGGKLRASGKCAVVAGERSAVVLEPPADPKRVGAPHRQFMGLMGFDPGRRPPPPE